MPATLSTLSDLSLINIFTYLPPEDLLQQLGQITSRWNSLQRATINVRNKKTLTLLIGNQAESLLARSPFPNAEARFSLEILRQKTLADQSTITRLTTDHQGLRSLHLASYSPCFELINLQVLLWSWHSTLTTLTLRLHLQYSADRTQHLQSLFININALQALQRLTLECAFSLDHPGPALKAVLGRLEEFYFSATHLTTPPGHTGSLAVTWPGHFAPALRDNQQLKRLEIPNAVQVSDLAVLYELPCRAAIGRVHLKNIFNKIEALSVHQLGTLCTNLISLKVLEFEADASISMAKLASCLAALSNLVELHLGLNFCINFHIPNTTFPLAFSSTDHHQPLPSVRRLHLNLKLTHHDQLPWHPFAALFPNLEQLQLDGLVIEHPIFGRLSRSIILEPNCTQCYSEGVANSGVRCLRMIAQIWQQKCPRLKRIHWPDDGLCIV